jgi:hypothetical protein
MTLLLISNVTRKTANCIGVRGSNMKLVITISFLIDLPLNFTQERDRERERNRTTDVLPGNLSVPVPISFN